jgi:hypothetical protein
MKGPRKGLNFSKEVFHPPCPECPVVKIREKRTVTPKNLRVNHSNIFITGTTIFHYFRMTTNAISFINFTKEKGM